MQRVPSATPIKKSASDLTAIETGERGGLGKFASQARGRVRWDREDDLEGANGRATTGAPLAGSGGVASVGTTSAVVDDARQPRRQFSEASGLADSGASPLVLVTRNLTAGAKRSAEVRGPAS